MVLPLNENIFHLKSELISANLRLLVAFVMRDYEC